MVMPFPKETSRTGIVKNPVSIFIPFFWFGVFNREISSMLATNKQRGRPPSLLFNYEATHAYYVQQLSQ